MSWLASPTISNIALVRQAVFIHLKKKKKRKRDGKTRGVDTIIRRIHLHSNNTSVCSVLGESQPSTVPSVSACVFV